MKDYSVIMQICWTGALLILFFAGKVSSIEAECTQCRCCASETCSMDGKCKSGCKNGYYGDKCYNRCPEGCSSDGCKGGICKSCKAGLYGQKCLNNCSQGCLEEKCDPDEFGACTLGCKNGFRGKNCEEKCFSKCRNDICNETHCIQGCIDGFWGHKCFMPCPLTCIKCHKYLDLGLVCGVCVNQFYNTANEKECRHRCPRNCISCSSYDNCSSCEFGYFGPSCNDICPSYCIGKICNINNGECTFRNVEQHSGIQCEKATNAETSDDNFSSVTAFVVAGSVAGTAIVMTAVFALFWKFVRNRKKPKMVQPTQIYANVAEDIQLSEQVNCTYEGLVQPSEQINFTYEGLVHLDAASLPSATQVTHQMSDEHTYEQLQK